MRMADLMHRWVDAMRAERFEDAWDLSYKSMKARSPATRDDPSLPYHLRWVWDGSPFDERDVLVRCYHGLGDTLQFARYLPLLAQRAASVTLEVQPRLIPLLQTMAGIERMIPFDPAHPSPPRECDLEITELGFALRQPPSAVPSPYLHTAPAPLQGGTVGLCYSAGEWDPERSIAAELFRGIATAHTCLSLVAEPTALPVLNPEGCPFDMGATASLVGGCELVITVDTMVAHLAGALGRPTWLLLKAEPDWRWTPGKRSSPWYPSMRIFTQWCAGDWAQVIREVERELDRLNCTTTGKEKLTITDLPLPRVPVSWGELLDKLTILEIKHQRIADGSARSNVARELRELSAIAEDASRISGVAALVSALKAVNEELWNIEDAIRAEEAEGSFGPEFIRLARSVYRRNDARAALKREINLLLRSELVEEKSYWSAPTRGIGEADRRSALAPAQLF